MDFNNQTLAGIVTSDHRTAAVLEKYNLDFCCKGKRSFKDACTESGLSPEAIATELEQVTSAEVSHHMPFKEMTSEQLISHILVNHHFYVKQSMPQISAHLERVATKHGDRFPEMRTVYELFEEIREDMTQHMAKEENILFPAIKNIENTLPGQQPDSTALRIVNGAVNVMESEHEQAGSILGAIRQLTNDYQAPEGACNTFRLSIAELKYFEDDLHRHVHLENNILFPKALEWVK